MPDSNSITRRKRIKRHFKGVYYFIRHVIDEFLTDNCSHLAASISYYCFFSLFPLALAAIAILGWLTSDPGIESKVIETVSSEFPVSQEFVASALDEVGDAWLTAGAIAIIGLLWGGSAVFNATRKALNAAWGIKNPRPFVVERFMELFMMMGIGLLLLLSFGASVVIKEAEVDSIGIDFVSVDVLLELVTGTLLFVAFVFMYKFVPNTYVRWRDVLIGAFMAAIGFEAAKHLFTQYAVRYTGENPVYGSLGTTIAVLLWLYVSAFIFLFCAKLTAVYARVRAGERLSRPGNADTASTLEYLGPLQSPVETVLLKSRQVIEGGVQSLTPTSWFNTSTDVSERNERAKKRVRPSYTRNKRRGRKY